MIHFLIVLADSKVQSVQIQKNFRRSEEFGNHFLDIRRVLETSLPAYSDVRKQPVCVVELPILKRLRKTCKRLDANQIMQNGA